MSPFYPPLPDPVPRSGLMSALGGYAAGQEMQNIALKRQQMQMQMQQQNQMQAALGNYAQTQDPAAFRKVSPMFELELRDKIAKLDPPEVARYGKLADLMERAGPMLTPQGWPAFKQAAVKAGLVGPDELPDTVTPQQLQQMVYARPLMQAMLKQRAAVPKAVGGMIYDPATGQFIEPPVSAVKQREMELKERGVAARERAVDIQGEKATRPPQARPVSPSTLKHQVTSEVDRQFKWPEVSATYLSQAKDEILSGMTATAKGYLTDTPNVPYEKLPQGQKDELLMKNTPAINKRARELFDKDRQARIDREYQARQGTVKVDTGGKSLQSMTTEELRAAIQAFKSGGGSDAGGTEEDEED